LVALIILPLGQGYVGLFAIAAFIGIIVLWRIGNWYAERLSLKNLQNIRVILSISIFPVKGYFFNYSLTRVGVFEIYLPGFDDELLYVLPD
jgi:FSR family fosmidomycin resistance protein-like MFS transporter